MQFIKNRQAKTPIVEALQSWTQLPHGAFYTPGHKRGVGISSQLLGLLGEEVFRADLPELPELDNLFSPSGVIAEAQVLAAEAFGAEKTWFLVNGSTCGILAAVLATVGQSEKIILPRNVHKSAIAALILSGAIPIFVSPEYDPDTDLAHSITPNAVALALHQHPEAKAVLMVYPTYYGACGNVKAIAQLCHQHGIPLLVDEAHGAHLGFHPDLPASALSQGADLAVQSTHKVLGAMTQASMLHLQGNRIDPERISQALALVQSTSPSYLLLASLDAARQQVALKGELLMTNTLKLAERARRGVTEIEGLGVLECATTPGFMQLDQTRLTVNVMGLGVSGYEADELLVKTGVVAELPSLQHVTFILSLGNTEADVEQLLQGFRELVTVTAAGAVDGGESQQMLERWREELLHVHPSVFLVPPMRSPREAYFAETEVIPIEQSDERICAEIICPYPPGIPALMPGEMINLSTLDYLQQVLALGGMLTGCCDRTLKTIKVVKN